MLSRRLAKQGYNVTKASSGAEALELIEENKTDLVLLDIMMPVMDGFEALSRIRKTRSPSELPVIMATAKDEGEAVIKALEMGANDYVTKPFDYPVVKSRVATQVALKRAHDKLESSHARMANDLAAAARIQASLLPQGEPDVDNYRFAWRYRPCDELAGDALNIQKLENGQVLFYLIDVCGHGVPAALLSVSVVHTLHAAPHPSSVVWRPKSDDSGYDLETPGQVAQRLNELYPIMDNGGLFFAIIYGLLDPQTRSLRIVVAGQPLPARRRSDVTAEMVGVSNPPIGMIDDLDFEETKVQFSQGDRILFYSDGITEMFGPEEEMFGDDRLIETWRESRSSSLDESLDGLTKVVLDWSGRKKFGDDVSLLAIEAC